MNRKISSILGILVTSLFLSSCNSNHNTKEVINISTPVDYNVSSYEDNDTSYEVKLPTNSQFHISEVVDGKMYFEYSKCEALPNLHYKMFDNKIRGLYFSTELGTSNDGINYDYKDYSLHVEKFDVDDHYNINYIQFSVPADKKYICFSGGIGWIDDLVMYINEPIEISPMNWTK